MQIGILSTGVYIPEKRITSGEIAKRAGLPLEVVEHKMGIKEKPAPGIADHTVEMGIRAARTAIEKAEIDPKEPGRRTAGTLRTPRRRPAAGTVWTPGRRPAGTLRTPGRRTAGTVWTPGRRTAGTVRPSGRRSSGRTARRCRCPFPYTGTGCSNGKGTGIQLRPEQEELYPAA